MMHDSPDHLSTYLLDSMISATSAVKGILFVLNGDLFLIKAERWMTSPVLSAPRNTDLVSKLEDRLAGRSLDDPKDSPVIQDFLNHLQCTVIIPVPGGSGLIAFFVLALPKASDPDSMLVQSILFYAAEMLPKELV